MICIKCGHKNPGNLNYCEKCNAILLKVFDEKEQASLLDVEDGFSYLYPEHVYVNQRVQNLLEAIYYFCHGVGTKEKITAAFNDFNDNFKKFEGGLLQEMLETMDSYKDNEFAREYARQMIYLLNKGSQLSREGIGQIEEFFERDDDNKDLIIEGILKIQQGNDNFGVANDLMLANLQVIDEERTRRQMVSRAEEFEARIKEAREGPKPPEADKKTEEKKEEEEPPPAVIIEEDIVEVEDLLDD